MWTTKKIEEMKAQLKAFGKFMTDADIQPIVAAAHKEYAVQQQQAKEAKR